MIFVETSARTAANCGQVFEEIAKAVSGYKEPVSTARLKAPQPEQDAKTIPVSSSGDKPGMQLYLIPDIKQALLCGPICSKQHLSLA